MKAMINGFDNDGQKIYVGGRGSGKTMLLIQQAAQNNGYIMCFSQQEASRVFRMAKEKGYDIRFPITPFDADFKCIDLYKLPIMIDNAEMVLSAMIHARIEALTMSGIKENKRFVITTK